MERKQRAKMPASQRAKQFMPFAAVKGLEKAIAEQDQLLNKVEQVELAEEQVRKINEELTFLEKGNIVSVRFYNNGRYQTLEGIVEQIDFVQSTIRVSKIVIPVKRILDLTHLSL